MSAQDAPRCESCRFWKKNSDTIFCAIFGGPDPTGQCVKLGEKVAGLYWEDDYYEGSASWFETAPDFGCILHEPRGDK